MSHLEHRGHSQCVLFSSVSWSEKERDMSVLYVNLLARVTLPPDSGDANLGSILHHVLVRDTGSVQHSLGTHTKIH